jgi:hypothetical protein
MAKRLEAIFSTLITLILFVGIPYILPNYIPEDLAVQLEQSGFNLDSFSNQMMIIGAITAGLTILSGFVDPTSVIALLVNLAQACSSLIFIILLLGVGNITGLGYTEFQIDMQGVQSKISMDLRVFVYISIVTIVLKMMQVYLKWNETRIEEAPPGRIAP